MMKATAIIQARMGSSRLPGKTLMLVMNRPLLVYQLERIRTCRSVGDIIIATTSDPKDNPIAELAKTENIHIFRGSEEDVLDRYYHAAQIYKASHIMRLTADCPFIQADINDGLFDLYLKNNLDYARTGESFAEGLDCEVFSFFALDKAWKDAKLRSEREHVTLYFRNYPEQFSQTVMENETDDSRFRLTVDEPEDFFVVKSILENLYETGRDFTLKDIKYFLNEHPEIYNKNVRIVRNEGLLKSLSEDKLAC